MPFCWPLERTAALTWRALAAIVKEALLIVSGGTAMTAGIVLGLILAVGAIIVGLCFVQDYLGTLKFWRSR
jgi:hypothetical protein